MGKLNEIQEQVTQSFGNNSFTTKITDTTVEFDSARDSFTFKDEVNVPVIKVDGVQSAPFTADEKAKLATVTTPMNMKGRVDTAAELPTEDVQVGDVYLVGASGSENFEEYICTEISGSPEAPIWECLGKAVEPQVQSDWDQSDSSKVDYIKNKPTIPAAQVQADWNQNDENAVDYIKHRICYDGFDSIVPFATTLDAEGNIGNYLVTGVKGVYFNPVEPILTGTDYTIMIGSKSVTFTTQGAPDNSAGGMGGTIPDAGTSFYQMSWNTSGFQDAPNGETAFIGVGADMTIFQEGETVKFGFPAVSEIDEKYVPFKTIRSNFGTYASTVSFKEHMFIIGGGDLTGIEFNIEKRAEMGESHFWQGVIESESSLSISTSTVSLNDSTGSLTVQSLFTNIPTLQANKKYKVEVWHNKDLAAQNNTIYAVFTELS